MKCLEDYVYTKKLKLDTDELKDSSMKMYELLMRLCNNRAPDPNVPYPITTQMFQRYNILMFPLPGFHNLFLEIQKTFNEVNKDKSYKDEKYYIQCWLNVYDSRAPSIGWHKHWRTAQKAWHGFYCLDTEPSSTLYRLSNGKQFAIECKDNLLVIGKSGEDEHRSTDWTIKERPRITIAYDIVPAKFLAPMYDKWLNHWIPI
jgi:hypothetical protein